ncbi:hypothetical protein D9M68_468950 [compost metagenome]
MLGRQLPAGSGSHTHHQGNGELPAGHMPQGRGRIDQGVQCQQAEVDRHHLDDRAHAAQRRADARANEGQFRQRCIADALRTELIQQSTGYRIGTAVAAHVFSHQEDTGVTLESFTQRLAYRRAIGHDLAHAAGSWL